MQCALALFAAQPTVSAQDHAALIASYPQLREELRRGWSLGHPTQRGSDIEQLVLAYAELKAGNALVAARLLRTAAAHTRRRGNEVRAQRLKTVSEMSAIDVRSAMKVIGLTLTAIIGAERFADVFSGAVERGEAGGRGPSRVSR